MPTLQHPADRCFVFYAPHEATMHVLMLSPMILLLDTTVKGLIPGLIVTKIEWNVCVVQVLMR